MVGTEKKGEGFKAKLLNNGIHEFRWASTERHAVDLWVAYNESLYETTDPNDTLYFLHEIISTKFPPVSYIVHQAQQLQSKFPQHPKTRSVLLFQSRFFGGFINTLSQLVNRKGQDVTRVFAMDERDEAIAWLLQGDEDVIN